MVHFFMNEWLWNSFKGAKIGFFPTITGERNILQIILKAGELLFLIFIITVTGSYLLYMKTYVVICLSGTLPALIVILHHSIYYRNPIVNLKPQAQMKK